jgi:hypothetical protein
MADEWRFIQTYKSSCRACTIIRLGQDRPIKSFQSIHVNEHDLTRLDATRGLRYVQLAVKLQTKEKV